MDSPYAIAAITILVLALVAALAVYLVHHWMGQARSPLKESAEASTALEVTVPSTQAGAANAVTGKVVDAPAQVELAPAEAHGLLGADWRCQLALPALDDNPEQVAQGTPTDVAPNDMTRHDAAALHSETQREEQTIDVQDEEAGDEYVN